jgi:hypothetical protein
MGALACYCPQDSKHNCGLVEAEFHRRNMHLDHGFNRLWTKIGAGSSSGNDPDTHQVFLTFSIEAAAAALEARTLVIAGSALA